MPGAWARPAPVPTAGPGRCRRTVCSSAGSQWRWWWPKATSRPAMPPAWCAWTTRPSRTRPTWPPCWTVPASIPSPGSPARGAMRRARCAPRRSRSRPNTASPSSTTTRWSPMPPSPTGKASSSRCSTRRRRCMACASTWPKPSVCRRTRCAWSRPSSAAPSVPRSSPTTTRRSRPWRRGRCGGRSRWSTPARRCSPATGTGPRPSRRWPWARAATGGCRPWCTRPSTTPRPSTPSRTPPRSSPGRSMPAPTWMHR